MNLIQTDMLNEQSDRMNVNNIHDDLNILSQDKQQTHEVNHTYEQQLEIKPTDR